MVAPDAPFPTTAASSPGDFKEAYEAAFAAGAEAIVSVHVAGTLSGTIKSAQIARDMLPDREIHVVDSLGASMAEGILARMGVELAADGRPAAEIAETLEARAQDMRHLRRPRDARVPEEGRPDQRRAGGDRHAAVGQADHHGQARRGRRRSTGSARGRRPANALIELIVERPIERLAILHTDHARTSRRSATRSCAASPRPRSGGRVRRARRARRSGRTSGPGCVGAAILYRASADARGLQRCDKVATTLPTGTIGEAPIAGPRLYSGRT